MIQLDVWEAFGKWWCFIEFHECTIYSEFIHWNCNQRHSHSHSYVHCTPYPKSYWIVNTHTIKRSHHFTYTCTTATTKFSEIFILCMRETNTCYNVIAQHRNHTQNSTRSILWIWMGNSHISLQKCNMNLSFTPIRSISSRIIFFCISAISQNTEWMCMNKKRKREKKETQKISTFDWFINVLSFEIQGKLI